MVNKKLKWYHYTAKVIMIGLFGVPLAPLLILISLASGEGPLEMYRVMWNDGIRQ